MGWKGTSKIAALGSGQFLLEILVKKPTQEHYLAQKTAARFRGSQNGKLTRLRLQGVFSPHYPRKKERILFTKI